MPRRQSGLSHVGLLVPWANTVMEHELPVLAGAAVAWHTARLVPANRGTRLDAAFVAGLHASIPASLGQLAMLPLTTVFLGCTAASFTEEIQTREMGTPTVRLVTAFGAIVRTVRRHGWSRVALATPYTQSTTDAEAEAFRRAAVDIVGTACLGLDDGFDTVSPEEVIGLAHRPGRNAAEALVISCTNLPTLHSLGQLERDLGMPVLSSNRAIALTASDRSVFS